MKTIVSIGAHHDDVEIGAGGTLAKYGKKGHRIIYVVATTTPHYELTDDERKEGKFLTNAEAIDLRKKEARQGARILGVKEEDIHFFDFKSMYWYKDDSHDRRYLDGNKQTIEEFVHLNENVPGREFILNSYHCTSAVNHVMKFLDDHEADIVLTHFPDDPHAEHYAVAALVSRAVMNLVEYGMGIQLYAWTEGDARHMLNSFAPTHCVDISETINTKLESLKVFKSQFKTRDPQPFLDASTKRAKAYGKLFEIEYAEVFMKYNTDPFDIMEMRLAPSYDPSKIIREF